MKSLKICSLVFIALALILGVLFSIAWLGQEEIPDLGSATATDSELVDDAYASPIRAAQDQMIEWRRTLSAPSISVAVAVNGQLVWAEAQGYADIESRTAATTHTVYPIGSVSKTITAALALKLVVSGALDLDHDIRDYVPEFPQKDYVVTLRQLLSHQAGIRHYGFAFIPPVFSEAALNRHFVTSHEGLSIFDHDPLLFEPDTNFEYSTYGYTLISVAIEAAGGSSFLDQLDANIFEPLHMTNSGADFPVIRPLNRATDYTAILSRKAVMQPPATDSSYKWAGGGLASTPKDLVRFASALMHDSLLPRDTRDMMFTPRKLANGELNPQHYGLGSRIGGLLVSAEGADDEIITLINHGGSSSGATCILMIQPDEDLVVAMAANSIRGGGSGPLTGIAANVMREFLRFAQEHRVAAK
jgi:CubicO group peptidase (beta-lactamase class C family)